MDLGILGAIGGLGLFLLGMAILVDGLKSLGGQNLRVGIARFTRSPLSGAVTGATATALVQSSSAVMVTTVGFAGASLITFPQALGIMFGANVGTTATGWIVSLLGFKLNLAGMFTPLILLGVMLRLFGAGRWREIGWAMAGFGVLFYGLAMMQAGMAGLQNGFTFERFEAATLPGKLALVLMGAAFTVVVQSSSAGVATTLAVMSAGAISFEQAALLVIGMHVGTTVTGLLASIGGAPATRRIALAHVLYNLIDGSLAFLLLPLYIAVAGQWLDLAASSSAQLALVGFHTAFAFVGALLGVTIARPYAALIERLVPDNTRRLAGRLDAQVLADAGAAIETLAATIRDVASESLEILARVLVGGAPLDREREAALVEAHREVEAALRSVRTDPAQRDLHRRHLAIIHALDHASRLLHRLQQGEVISTLHEDSSARELARRLHGVVAHLDLRGRNAGDEAKPLDFEQMCAEVHEQLAGAYESWRAQTLLDASRGREDVDLALRRLDAARWLSRVAHHVWRLVHYSAQAGNLARTADADVADQLDEDENGAPR